MTKARSCLDAASTDGPAPARRGRRPLLWAWSLAFLVFAAAQARYVDVPAYHDGLVHWNAAQELALRPWRPFLDTMDTGHPPLVPWLLALLWQTPLPPLLAMHLLVWAASATLLAAVFETGRRTFGWEAGLGAALLTALHPVVVAQSLQLNLDLFMAAFAWVAILGFVSGRPLVALLGCVGATFSKLNGMIALAPFLCLGCLVPWRRLALAPAVATLVSLAAWQVGKRALTGHWFDSGEFEQGDQLALVPDLPAFLARLQDAQERLLKQNGNKLVAASLLLAAGIVLALLPLRSVRDRLRAWWQRPPARDASSAPSPAAVLVLCWLMLLFQLAGQSVRRLPPLVRYFVVCYPTLYLTLFALLSVLPVMLRRWTSGVVPLALSLCFWLRWDQRHAELLPPRLAAWFLNPPPGTPTNYEINLQFTDQLALLRDSVAGLEPRLGPGDRVAVPWPFAELLREPGHGLVRTPWSVVEASLTDPLPEPPPKAVLAFSQAWSSANPQPGPEQVPCPRDFRLTRALHAGRIWLAALEPER